MIKYFYLLIGICFICTNALAASTAPVIYSATNPVVDGKLDEPCWQTGQWQEKFVSMKNTAAAGEKTAFKVVNTPRGLYIGVKAEEKLLKSIPRKPDDPVWHDDSIEIVLAPTAQFATDKNVRENAHFIINAHGSGYDAYMTAGIGDVNWNPFWQAATQITPEGFTMEVFLPFTLFSDRDIKSGDWRFNLLRTHKGGRITLYSIWNPSALLHDTDNYGILKDIKCDTQRFNIELSPLTFRRAVIASKACTVLQTAFKGKKNTPYQISAMIYGPDRKFANIAVVNAVSDASGNVRTDLPAEFKKSGQCRLRLAISDDQGKVYDQMLKAEANLAPLELTVRHPVYRNTLFASDPDREIKTVLKLDMPAPQRKTSVLKLKLTDSSGRVLDEKIIKSPPENYEYSASAAQAAVGPLTLECTVNDNKDLQLVHKFYVAPPRKNNSEVYIAGNGNLMVNGQPFFIRGFMGAYKDFEDMRKSGCNTVHFYTLNRRDVPEILERLDSCQQNGLRAILSPFHHTSAGFFGIRRKGKVDPAFSAAELERMRKMVLAVKDHPALLAWYTFDEPRGAEWAAELQKVYHILRELDPQHPVLGADNGAASCISLQNACDIIGLDMYLNPSYKGEPLRPVTMILNAVERIARNIQPGKMLIYIPQAYDSDSFMPQDFIRERRPPTREECAATVFGSLAAGAKGILAYKIGNKALVTPGKRHSNAGIYADENLRKSYLEYIMPTLKQEENFFLVPGSLVPAINAQRKLPRTMPDGQVRTMTVNEKKNYGVKFENGK